jgi:hypothetical protein
MATVVILCEKNGEEIARYEFDCSCVSEPRKLDGGPITIHFTPKDDAEHQMETNGLPHNESKTIKGANTATAST